ncbi:hypothetical protein TNCV_2357101 [Trichonephila clavipes]|nr:hypothetical protein TNCV_2357101 [Trichonephila clavipes]
MLHLSFTTGKTKIQYISSRKRRKDAAVLKNASLPSGVMYQVHSLLDTLRKALQEKLRALPTKEAFNGLRVKDDTAVGEHCCMKGILETGGVMGQCVQMWTRNYGALDQTARVCFGVLCANRKKEGVKRDFGPANKKERGACCEHTPGV